MKRKAIKDDNEHRYLELKETLSVFAKIAELALHVGEKEAACSLGLPLEKVEWAIHEEHMILDKMLRIDKDRRTMLLKSFEIAREGLRNLPKGSNISSIIIKEREYCTLRKESTIPTKITCPVCLAEEGRSTNVELLGKQSYIAQHQHQENE